MISHDFWQARLGAGPDVIGKRLALNNEDFTVIGVLPRGFRFSARQIDLWMPLQLGDEERFLQAIARMRDGISLSQAQTEMDALAKRLALENGRSNKTAGAVVVSLQENLVGNLRLSLLVLLGASAFVLLIGCSNLTNLLLARSLAQAREITIRFALGAGRLRIIRQLITESTLIGLLGGAGGTLIAIWGISAALPLLSRMGGPYAFIVSRMTDVAVDRRVLVFGMAIYLWSWPYSARSFPLSTRQVQIFTRPFNKAAEAPLTAGLAHVFATHWWLQRSA
jgi:putative ABC transport system permease protein